MQWMRLYKMWQKACEPKWGAHMSVKPKKLLRFGDEVILVTQKNKKVEVLSWFDCVLGFELCFTLLEGVLHSQKFWV